MSWWLENAIADDIGDLESPGRNGHDEQLMLHEVESNEIGELVVNGELGP